MATQRFYCSFCGRSSDEVGKMLEKTNAGAGDRNRHVFICLQCAAEAVEILSSAKQGQQPSGEEISRG